MTTRPCTNDGQRIALTLNITAPQLAEAAGVSRQAAHMWLRGTKRPGPAARTKIRGRWPELTEASWDRLPQRPASPESAPEPSPAAPPPRRSPATDEGAPGAFVDARTSAKAHLDEVEQMLADAKEGERMADVHKLLDQRRKAIVDLARFSGELTATEESKLTETQRWKEVRQGIVEAVSRFPEAAKALIDALEAMDA